MFRNGIYEVTLAEINQLKSEMKQDNSLFLVELEGEKIQSKKDYFTEIEAKFYVPRSCELIWDRYFDWIRDLSWFEEGTYEGNKIEKFALIIYQYSKFVEKNLTLKKEIINGFTEIILPFWEEEVERVVVEGTAKSFNVYLVVN